MYSIPKAEAPRRLTSASGHPFAPDMSEPPPGSVVMTAGLTGTAWQRHSDGRWHSTTRGILRWDKLTKRRNLWLVYRAPEVN